MFEIVELRSLSDAARDRVQAIYEESFPASERVPFQEIVEAEHDGREITSIAVEEDGTPIGFAFFSRLDAVGWLFFEYFAVASDRRGAGVGQALCTATTDGLRARGEDRPFAMEVEDPDAPGIDEADKTVRVKRIRFWEKTGAKMLPVQGYVIPDLDGGDPLPMRLMWMPGPAAGGDPDAAELLELAVALYEVGYGLDSDHELVVNARNGGVFVS